ncbi:MAG: glycine zipper family protein, partial [Limisphaerales bacterium]
MNDKNRTTTDKNRNADANRDPITGAPGAHPVGTGVGATGGGAAGAAIGAAVGGPVG